MLPARKRLLHAAAILLAIATVAHLLFAPVPIEPRAFEAPANRGYHGPFAKNTRLSGVQTISVPAEGPEDGAIGPDGLLYVSLRDGTIARMAPDGGRAEAWVNTGGAPLGLDFGADGTLWVADAYRGLLAVDRKGHIEVRCDHVAGSPIRYADDLAVTDDGRVYFSDASTKFGAEASGGTYPASVLDMFEHGRYGRVIRYQASSGTAVVLRDGLAFANGVALSPDQSVLYVNETGRYRVLTLQLRGEQTGDWGVLIDALPGFPDNIETGRGGRLWVGLVVPRNPMLDATAGLPWARKVAFRLPELIRPKAASYGHLIALSADGQVTQDLQTPDAYTHITGAIETPSGLFITSLTEPKLARLPWPQTSHLSQ